MKQIIEKIKISEINEIIKQMGVHKDTIINLTIETVEDDFLNLLHQIGQEAKANGLTEEILEELLADES